MRPKTPKNAFTLTFVGPTLAFVGPALALVRPALALVRPALAFVRPALAVVRPALTFVRPALNHCERVLVDAGLTLPIGGCDAGRVVATPSLSPGPDLGCTWCHAPTSESGGMATALKKRQHVPPQCSLGAI